MNKTQQTDIGQFGTIGRNRIYRASGANYPFPYNDPPIAITPGPQNITYTSFHQPASISRTVNGTPYLLEYTYDADQQRNYSKLRNMNNPGTPVEERWYEHGLETVRQGGSTSNTHKALYVEGGDGLCAIIAVGPTTTLTPFAVYKDHLGSIVTITKKNGSNAQIYVEQNFDAWGRHRNPATWAYAEPVLPPWLFRGYTGHEGVWPFSLINMNGRMYDPLNGRMLSADNYVQGSHNTQGFNRYAYALNNPMMYTDPSGEIAWFVPVIVGAVIGSYAGGAINQGNMNPFQWNLSDPNLGSSMIIGGLLGASAGAAFSAAASAGSWNLLGGITGYQTSGGVLGSTGTAWNMVSNGLLTASVNIGSSAAMGSSTRDIAANGLIGLAAGGLGGWLGPIGNSQVRAMTMSNVGKMNSLTAMLNGAGTRAYSSIQMGVKDGRVATNIILGAGEGWLSDALVGNRVGSLFESSGDRGLTIARYLTGTLSQGVTSVPGAGFGVASYLAMPAWAVGAGLPLGLAGFMAQPIFNHGLPDGGKYPYPAGLSDIFRTSYAELLHKLIFGN